MIRNFYYHLHTTMKSKNGAFFLRLILLKLYHNLNKFSNNFHMIKPGYSLVVVVPPRGILTNQGLVEPLTAYSSPHSPGWLRTSRIGRIPNTFRISGTTPDRIISFRCRAAHYNHAGIYYILTFHRVPGSWSSIRIFTQNI